MELEGLSLCSHSPSIGPCLEPVESDLQLLTLFIKDTF